MVQTGTTAYVIDGNDVTIECNIVSGTHPITISWFRNGVEDTSFGNVSTITISNVNDGDMYMCRAQNRVGFDEETTMIVVQRKWYILYAVLVGDSLLQLCNTIIPPQQDIMLEFHLLLRGIYIDP